jgi:hypothetical protein
VHPGLYAKDLLADPVLRVVDRTFLLWVLVGLVFPFGLGIAMTGSVIGGLTGLLWGGAVRILFLHHATFYAAPVQLVSPQPSMPLPAPGNRPSSSASVAISPAL